MKKICVVTGSRAEYGLLKPLLIEISKKKDWVLQLIVTGMHLSPEFGLTCSEIEKDGFGMIKKVEMLLSSDTETGVIKSMGVGLIGFADALTELAPDLVLVLGDRFEILAVVEAALIFKIPVAHLHGGEITSGALDDSIRHAITKMSHIHFASTEEYRNRIIQMGENPANVFNVGALSLDNIYNNPLLTKHELEKKLRIKFKKLNYLVTYHPETLAICDIKKQVGELLSAINEEPESLFIFTKSNADNGGRTINKMIDEFVINYPAKAVAFTSLGPLYLSLMHHVDAVVGNSSSGIVEAPSLKTATINIGERQKGRLQALSIVNCKAEKNDIRQAFEKIKSHEFKTKLLSVTNPYGKGDTAPQIVNKLSETDWKSLIKKHFYDYKA